MTMAATESQIGTMSQSCVCGHSEAAHMNGGTCLGHHIRDGKELPGSVCNCQHYSPKETP